MATNSQTQQNLISEDDLQAVLKAFYSISSRNIFNFGIELGLSYNHIETFKTQCNGDMKGWLREIMNERLKQEPPLTWHDIVTALRSPSVSEDHLASQIESHYKTDSQTPTSVPQWERAELSLFPQRERAQLSSVPQRERAQLSSVPQRERAKLSSGPQRERAQLSSGPQRERAQLSSVPQRERAQLSSVPQRERAKLSSGPQRERAQLSSVPQQETAQPLQPTYHIFHLHTYPTHNPRYPPSNPPSHHSHYHPPPQLYPPDQSLYQPQPMYYFTELPRHRHPLQYTITQLPSTQYHTHYSTAYPRTHYTHNTPPQPPTSHQPPTPYYPPHYLPPIQPPQAAGSTTHSDSGSVLEETVPPAAILQPSVRPHLPHSGPSQDQHGIETAPVAHPLIPTDPYYYDQRSVSIQPSPTHTSATPPLQSPTHSQSSGQTTATAVSPHSECDDALAHQSRIVEEVINRHTIDLTRAIGNNLTYFTNKFIELGFIARDASNDILTQTGVGTGKKGSQLLNLVIENCRTAHYKKNWFDKLVGVFLSEAAYDNLATSMTRDLTTSMAEEFKSCVSHNPSSPSTSHAACPSADHLAPPVKSFIDYVKTFYTSKNVESNTSVVKWPPTPSKVFINLVCIDRHSVSGRSREYDEVTEAMVRDGNVDVIKNVTKGPIDFSKIGKNISVPNSKQRATSDEKKSDKRRLILVEGAPGVGKSTFAWEFCRRWEGGEIAQQYQLVLLLRLREERISNAKSLEDLIYHPSKDVRQAVCHELLRSHDFHALIILEGFDELPDSCRKGVSVLMDLIAGKLLPLATILVTSRPLATEKIRLDYGDRIYQHIEILGFTGQQITEYIESTLPQHKVSDLKAYLESHPQIRAGMYIPLNSAIVVTVYEERQSSGYAMPTTLTELYTCLTQTLLLRYLRGHPEYETDSKFLETLNELPPPVDGKFHKLCRLAYDGTVGTSDQVQLIFKGLSSDFDDLGFMDSVTELYVQKGAVSSHNFLHLTFQEFFAAVHISSMSREQQVEHFKRHMGDRLKVVLRFLAGLNKFNCFSIEDIANNFLQTPSTCEGSRYLIMSCDAAVGIDLVQWLFEAQSDDVIEHVLGHKTIEFDLSSGLLPLDYYSLGYCISHSQCQWVLGLGRKIGEVEVRMSAAGAGTRSDPGGRVTLVISGNTELKLNTLLPHLSLKSLTISPTSNNDVLVYEDCIAVGAHVTSTTNLRELCISSNICNEKAVEPITAALASNQSLPLERLELECECTFTSTAVDSLAQFITNTTILQYLSIKRCTFSAGVRVGAITAALGSNRLLPLEILEFESECTFTATAGDSLAQFITNTTTLQCLSIRRCTFSAGVGAITAALASNQSLPLDTLALECECTFTATAGDSLAQFITNTTTLQCLSIRWCAFSADALLVLARAIHHNSILQIKNVEDLNLTVNGDNEAKDLAQLLVEYPEMVNSGLAVNNVYSAHTRKLNLSNSSISDAGAVALAQALHHNSTLTQLNMSNNSISDAGAVALAQALHDNSTLKLLDLSGNDGIGEEGTRQLVQALTVNTSIYKYVGLWLPRRCKEYATQCPQYYSVENRICFCK